MRVRKRPVVARWGSLFGCGGREKGRVRVARQISAIQKGKMRVCRQVFGHLE